MSKSLADLRAERSTSRPRRTYRAVVGEGQKYVAEVQRLVEEHDDLIVGLQQGPRKASESVADNAEVVRLRTALAERRDLMAEYEGELIYEATKSDGEWVRWKIAHPARAEGEPGHRDDLILAGGTCNSDDLIDDLAAYVVAWEGEDLQPGDFDALNLLRPDKKAIAAGVVGLYETGDDLGELLRGLSAHLANVTSSDSPKTSG